MESIAELVRRHDKAVKELLDETALLEGELKALAARLRGVNEQLRQLTIAPGDGKDTKRETGPGGPKKYGYQEGRGFILVETGEVIGLGSALHEALRGVREW